MVLSETAQAIIDSQNSYNIKLIVLSLLFAYSIFAYFIKDNIDLEKSYMHYWFGYLTRVLSLIYVVFSPLFYLLLLKDSITLEIFYIIIIGFYSLMLALAIGMGVWKGGTSILQILGVNDWGEFKDNYKERRSMRKYG